MSDIKICTQISFDSPLVDQLSIRENPENSPHPTGYDAQACGHHLVAPVARLWNRDRTEIRVKILNGSDRIKRRIKKYAREWNNYSGVKFVFVDSNSLEHSDVRVNVNDSGQTWSYIGTECLAIPQDQPTMNFGWLTDGTREMEFGRTILHEFGHALGFLHEHQSPAAGISWRKDRVYDYYRENYGWTNDVVDRNIFDYYHYPQTRESHFDSRSIMTYTIPASFTTDRTSTSTNTTLSRTDKEFVARLYPPDRGGS